MRGRKGTNKGGIEKSTTYGEPIIAIYPPYMHTSPLTHQAIKALTLTSQRPMQPKRSKRFPPTYVQAPCESIDARNTWIGRNGILVFDTLIQTRHDSEYPISKAGCVRDGKSRCLAFEFSKSGKASRKAKSVFAWFSKSATNKSKLPRCEPCQTASASSFLVEGGLDLTAALRSL